MSHWNNKEYQRKKRLDLRYTLFVNAKHRAKKNNITFDITIDDIVVPEYCPIFGVKLEKGKEVTMPNSPSLDRKDSRFGYTKENIWVISHKANKFKNSASLEELQTLAEALKQIIPIKTIIPKNGIGKKRILVVGDSCKDVWIEGQVRLSPEAPTIVFKPENEKFNGGMAANVYSNLLSLAPEYKIDFITNSNNISKIRYIDKESGYTVFRIDLNDKSIDTLSFKDFEEQLNKINTNFNDFDGVIISDYNKGFLNTEIMGNIIDKFFDLKIPVMVDTKATLGKWSINAFCIKINNKEFQQNLEKISNPDKYCQNLIVTKSDKGTLFNGNLIPTKKVDTFNVSGCGDTYISALMIHYLENKNLIEAIKFANYAASFKATKKNVYTPTMNEVINFIKS